MANMIEEFSRNGGTRAARRGMTMVIAGALGLGMAGAGALAQQKAPAQQKAAPPAAAAPAAAAPAAGAAPQSAWVKLCEVASIQKIGAKDKDGKPVTENKNLCLTHHERLDGTTGMVIVSAAVRQLEGVDKSVLMLMVPLGMSVQPGVRAAVYSKDLWAKVAKNEKVDEKLLKPIDLKYSLCHPAGCTAEIEATKDMLEQMKSGGGMMVLAMNAGGQPIAFPVPLDGFAASLTGAPVDNKEYTRARAQLMLQIRQRQTELMQQAEQQQAAGGAQQPAAGAAAPAPAAKAPPKK